MVRSPTGQSRSRRHKNQIWHSLETRYGTALRLAVDAAITPGRATYAISGHICVVGAKKGPLRTSQTDALEQVAPTDVDSDAEEPSIFSHDQCVGHADRRNCKYAEGASITPRTIT